jgi:putative transposase
MSRRGNCWDNAVAASFFHTLKTQLPHHVIFKTKTEESALFLYIEAYYNRQRRHSSNRYLSPAEFEKLKKDRKYEIIGLTECPFF